MAYTPKPGSFSLFRNDRKEKDAHPDYRGDGMLPDGSPAWISAWLKEANGKKFFSISIQPKERQNTVEDRSADFRGSPARGGGGAPVAGRGGSGGGFEAGLDDSDIPFASRESLW